MSIKNASGAFRTVSIPLAPERRRAARSLRARHSGAAGCEMVQAGRSEIFSSAEIAFLAKEELIMIMPKIRMAELKFLHVCKMPIHPAPCTHALTLPLLPQGTVDEMRPPNPISVPLWLALFFKKRDKCRLKPPDWLEPEALERTLADERANAGQFAEIPFHYIEVAKELLECAADDLPDVHRVRSLLKDIEDVRRGKVERGLRNFDQGTTGVKLTNLSAMELNRIRTVAAGALDEMRTFVPTSEQEQEEQQTTQSASQPASSAPGNAQLQEALQRRAERR